MDEAAVNKMITTLNLPAPPKADGARQAQWEEIRSVFPIYLALAKHLQLEIPFPPNKRVLPEKADLELFSRALAWLDSMDQRVLVHQLRHLLQMTTLNASESGLRALIMRHLRKPAKSPMDRDKIDFLMVQYFALCVPTKIYHKQIELNDVAQVMKPVLGEMDTAPLPWCEPLEKMIVALRSLKSVRDILKTDFIEQGRRVKEKAGGMFYDPSAMLAFVRFNFLLRRTLIELMHADLIFIRSGINHLEQAGARTVDCQTFGLTSAEPIARVRALADDWKQPFQKEYTERSVSQAFEKLLALRADVDRTAVRVLGKSLDAVAEQAHDGKGCGRQRSGGDTGCGTYEREGRSRGESQGRGSEARTRFRVVHGTGLGATDIGAAFARPFDDDGASRRSAAADVVVGSGGVCDRRRTGRGRFAARGGGAGVGDGGGGKGQGIGERHGPGSRAADRTRGGFAAAGTRGTGETGQRYGSSGESGNQHEAAAFRAGRSREIVIPCWERWQARNTVRERISLAKHERIDTHGRRGVCAIAERVLASGTPASRPFRSDKRLMA